MEFERGFDNILGEGREERERKRNIRKDAK